MIEKTKATRMKGDVTTIFIKIISYALIGFFALLCLLPFVLMISSSFSSERSIAKNGFSLIPSEFSLTAYRVIFTSSDVFWGSYLVTVLITVIGTAVGLFLISMVGYALQRPDFILRNKISFFIYFTTLFSGGLVPYYLLISKYMGLKDSYLSILLPGLMSPWLIILMRNFMKAIPHSLTEAARIDGASDFQILVRIFLPISKPALATIGLFIALQYWNEWYSAMLFLSPNMKYRPLQLLLYNIMTQAEYIKNSAAAANITIQETPTETIKMATAVISTGPVILFYPFVQKYFVKGLSIGAVKG